MKLIEDMSPTPANQEIVYNALDCMHTLELRHVLNEQAPAWSHIANDYATKMIGPILAMMRRGVLVDQQMRAKLLAQVENRKSGLTAHFDYLCEQLFGCQINPASAAQLKILFYSWLGIPEVVRSKRGDSKVTTDADALESIVKNYSRGAPFALLLLAISDLTKQSEFLQQKLRNGRASCSYNIAGTDNFRLSSSDHPLRFGCVPDIAEALTPEGWVEISKRPPVIAQWEDGKITFVPANWTFYPYTGTLPTYDGRCVRGSFTPNHRMLTITSKGNALVLPTETVMTRRLTTIPVTGELDAGKALDPLWIRKLVMLAADGNQTPNGSWRVKVKKERKARRAELLLGRGLTVKRGYGYYDFSGIADEQFTKEFPDITQWDLTSRKIFFDELRYWDSHIRGNSYIYYTTNAINADLVVTAAHLTGYSASINVNVDNSNKYGNTSKKPLFMVNISTKKINRIEAARWTNQIFSGIVGCPTVASGFWLVRMNGGIHVTGNSNIQNVPDWMRRSFVPDPGYTMFQADQAGAEAKVVAYESGDPAYIEACNSGDAHTMVAAMVYGFEPVRALADRKFYRDKSYRDLAKRGSHGSNYYGQPYTLAQQMKCDQEAAAQFQARYFKAFPGISAWHRYKQRELVNKGYLVNPFGFRRTFWGRTWDDATLRKAIAFSPQSTVGILTNVALHKLWDRFEPSGDVQILVNGHDAVIGQVRTSKLAELLPQVLDTITIPFHITDINGITRLCTIPWEIAIGSNWGKCTKDNPDGLKEWRPPT